MSETARLEVCGTCDFTPRNHEMLVRRGVFPAHYYIPTPTQAHATTEPDGDADE